MSVVMIADGYSLTGREVASAQKISNLGTVFILTVVSSESNNQI